MKHQQARMAGARGLSIFYQYWQPEDDSRALILVVHGAGEHGGRYEPLATYFTARGYAVAAFDHPNHGRSEGRYGHVDRFDDFLETLALFQKQVVQDFPGLPLVLLGHSLGGLISTIHLLDHQNEFAACVLSGPAIKTDIEPPPLQMFIIRLLSAITPKLGVLALDPNGVSRDPAEVEKYVNDPLVNHGKMTARKVAELFRAMALVQSRVEEIKLPMLILHGGEDPMTAPSGSQFLHDHISSAEKQLTIYPGLYHEIFNEPEREQVFADVLQWLDTRIG